MEYVSKILAAWLNSEDQFLSSIMHISVYNSRISRVYQKPMFHFTDFFSKKKIFWENVAIVYAIYIVENV